jgi:hypothetical protein
MKSLKSLDHILMMAIRKIVDKGHVFGCWIHVSNHLHSNDFYSIVLCNICICQSLHDPTCRAVVFVPSMLMLMLMLKLSCYGISERRLYVQAHPCDALQPRSFF